MTFYQCCGYGCSYDPDSFYYDFRIHVKKIPDPDPYLDSFFLHDPDLQEEEIRAEDQEPLLLQETLLQY